MHKKCTEWHRMAQNGTERHRMAPNESEFFKLMSIKRHRMIINTQNDTECNFCAILHHSVPCYDHFITFFSLLSNSVLFLAFYFSFCVILCRFVPLLLFCAFLLTLSMPFCAILCTEWHRMTQSGTERHRMSVN